MRTQCFCGLSGAASVISCPCEDAAENPNNQAEQDRDLEAYAQTMRTRKSRSDAFLRDPKATFSLLSLLTLHLLIQTITQVAFKLVHSDRERLGFSRDGYEKAQHAKRRRCSMKGLQPQAAPVAADVQTPSVSLQQLLTATRAVIRNLWKLLDGDEARSVWSVAASYWPADQSRDELLEALTSDSLKTIAALKFRITMKFDFPPYSLLGMSAAADLGEADEAGDPDPRVAAFLSTPACCLDPFWGQVVQSDVKQEVDTCGALSDHIAIFEKHTRAVSLREEATHALQRKLAGGFTARPRAFDRQAASMVLSTAEEHFKARGGQCLTSAEPDVQKSMELVRKKKVVHHRPKQFGSGMFAYIAHQLKIRPKTSREHWRMVWKGMTLEQKAPWTARNRMTVAVRRQQNVAALAQRCDRGWLEQIFGFHAHKSLLYSLELPINNKAFV